MKYPLRKLFHPTAPGEDREFHSLERSLYDQFQTDLAGYGSSIKESVSRASNENRYLTERECGSLSTILLKLISKDSCKKWLARRSWPDEEKMVVERRRADIEIRHAERRRANRVPITERELTEKRKKVEELAAKRKEVERQYPPPFVNAHAVNVWENDWPEEWNLAKLSLFRMAAFIESFPNHRGRLDWRSANPNDMDIVERLEQTCFENAKKTTKFVELLFDQKYPLNEFHEILNPSDPRIQSKRDASILLRYWKPPRTGQSKSQWYSPETGKPMSLAELAESLTHDGYGACRTLQGGRHVSVTAKELYSRDGEGNLFRAQMSDRRRQAEQILKV